MTTLLIAEKPTAARKIAKALSTNGKVTPREIRGVPYFTISSHRETLIVVSALGHLYGLQQGTKGWQYPIFEYQWVPIHEVEKKRAKSRNYLNAIKNLASKATSFISACDYDLEGSLIAYNILKFCVGEEGLSKAKRMKFSSLTDKELLGSYENLDAHLNFPWIEAAKTRHEVDWVFGVNLTRALTLALKEASGYFSVVSTGRVQGPLLKFIVDREKTIQSFVPTPYWVIKAKLKVGKALVPLQYEHEKISTRVHAETVVQACKGQEGQVEDINESNQQIPPPFPFNLGDLQHAAYRSYRFSPKRTLAIAESLYLKSLISYPRTDSQRIPKSISLRSILNQLSSQSRFREGVQQLLQRTSLSIRNGPKTDPAHPAIHPTGEEPPKALSSQEIKIYELITRRFMASMGTSAQKTRVKVSINVKGYRFFCEGETILHQGWIAYYKQFFRSKTISLPPMKIGEKYPLKGITASETYTAPPPHYSMNSLVQLMETQGIGTKATRADITEILVKRKFLSSAPPKASELAFAVVNTLEKYCPTILDVETTRNLEHELEIIRDGQSNRDQVLQETKNLLLPVLSKIKSNAQEIGTSLTTGLKQSWNDEKIVGPCPDCSDGELMIIKSPKTRKRFIGCSNYKHGCTTSFPLTSKGKIYPMNKPCPDCGYPMLRIYFGRGKPMISCVNWVECPGREKRKRTKKRKSKGAGNK
jgi:DNA topoisomerase-1